jgi:hypothetical protein
MSIELKGADAHILLERSDEPDCRFVAAWLTKAAEAQTFWLQALNDRSFADRVQLLYADITPHLAAVALEIFGELERQCHVAVLDLYSDEDALFCREFGLMVQLGFFVVVGASYRMSVPEQVTLEAVKQAALAVLSTATDSGDGMEVLNPEHQLHTFSACEAGAWRFTLIKMRRIAASTHHRSI